MIFFKKTTLIASSLMVVLGIILFATSNTSDGSATQDSSSWWQRRRRLSQNPNSFFVPILNWDLDFWLPQEANDDSVQRLAIPSLTQPFYNNVLDVHSTMSAKDTELIFSTNGNWHLALRRMLDEKYFPTHPSAKSSYLLTTSPPISVAQMSTGLVKVGNVMYEDAQPHLVVAPGKVLTALETAGFVDGARIPLIRTYGNVILKRRGDRRYQTFWDLKKVRPGKFASSDPAEGGSFNNYRNSVLNIALNNPRKPGLSAEKVQRQAERLQAKLFDTGGVATIGPPMHRSVPHMIATGAADVGLFFLHLAVMTMKENPGVFTAVYLGGAAGGGSSLTETDDWEVLALGQDPLVGNQVGTFSAVKTTTPQNAAQTTVVNDFLSDLQSPEFTTTLAETGLRRPV